MAQITKGLSLPLDEKRGSRHALWWIDDALADADGLGPKKPLQQSFLWAVMLLLLVLRHRKATPLFLAPDATDANSAALFKRVETSLNKANAEIHRSHAGKRRRIHRAIPDAVSNALAFLNKTGGNPDIIRAIAQELEEDEAP